MYVYTAWWKNYLGGVDIVWNPYLCAEMEIAQQNGRLRYRKQKN